MTIKHLNLKTFKNQNFDKHQTLERGEYENCTFNNCNFSGQYFSNNIFRECNFISCDLSMMLIENAVLNDVKFKDCKLLGVKFNKCSDFLFSVHFENCILNLSSFYKLKLKKIIFKNCKLQEVDFSETDLTSSLFENCDLERAVFDRTILEKADFVSSYNYSINPENNRVKKARFSLHGLPGLLEKYGIEIKH